MEEWYRKTDLSPGDLAFEYKELEVFDLFYLI